MAKRMMVVMDNELHGNFKETCRRNAISMHAKLLELMEEWIMLANLNQEEMKKLQEEGKLL